MPHILKFFGKVNRRKICVLVSISCLLGLPRGNGSNLGFHGNHSKSVCLLGALVHPCKRLYDSSFSYRNVGKHLLKGRHENSNHCDLEQVTLPFWTSVSLSILLNGDFYV